MTDPNSPKSPDEDSRKYWSGLLGYEIDPWLGMTLSGYKDHLVALGVIAIKWNAAEWGMRNIVGVYLGFPEDSASVITRHLGNVPLIDALLDFASLCEKEADVLDEIRFISRFFNRCRENRNDLMHSLMRSNLMPDGWVFEMMKPASQRARETKRFHFELDDLRAVADSIERLQTLLLRFAQLVEIRLRPETAGISVHELLQLGRPSLPDRLIPLAPEVRQDDRA